MAHYAYLDSNNIVVKVLTGVDETVTQNGVGGSSEAWEQFYQSLEWNAGLTCKRTSYNGNIRKQYAGIGFIYLPNADVFVLPQPHGSWTLDANHDWQPPTPKPEGNYRWFEPNQQWIEVV